MSTSLTDDGSSDESAFSASCHSDFLAKPCCGSAPMFANCGHTTGIPPRIGSPGANVAVFPMNRTSLPPAGIQEVTCAPFRYTSAELPDGCESSTVDIPFFPGTMGGVMGSDIDGRAPDSASRSHWMATGWAVPEGVSLLNTSRLIWTYSLRFAGTSSSGKIAVDRTLGLAGATINAFVRMDEELIRAFVNAVDRTDIDASAILGVLAGFSYDVGHVVPDSAVAHVQVPRVFPVRKIDSLG